MPRRAPIALLLCLAAAAILSPSASAVPIHRHMTVERVVGHDPNGPLVAAQEIVQVVNVAPPDSDDDGCKNARDSYNGPGCNPPPPPPAPAPVESVQPAPAPVATTTTTTSGGCPSYMAAEASSPGAVNPSSGAAGCYQVLPSTQAAYPECSDVNSSGCVAAICADQGNAAWASSGAVPCDYIEP